MNIVIKGSGKRILVDRLLSRENIAFFLDGLNSGDEQIKYLAICGILEASKCGIFDWIIFLLYRD